MYIWKEHLINVLKYCVILGFFIVVVVFGDSVLAFALGVATTFFFLLLLLLSGGGIFSSTDREFHSS
jgi:hypothetical protein